MRKEFPELTMTRGYYDCPIWGKRDHWWLQDPDGNVVDPTAIQFPSNGIGEYHSIPDDAPEPVGRCMQCGELFFSHEHAPACSATCAVELEKEWGGFRHA